MVLLICSPTNTFQKNDFYDIILNNFNENSYYLTFKVESSNYNGDIVIENDDLYYYLQKSKKISKRKYIEYLKKHLENKLPIKLNGDIFLTENFIKLIKNSTIDEDANKGLDFFLTKYFDNKFLF